MPDELWERVLRVNLTGPLLATKRVIPPMLEGRGGGVINIASVGGLRAAATGAAYISSKHGLIGLAKNTATNYAADDIRCVAICPGGVDTGITPGGEPSEDTPR
jgi:NAD(P)-dependent dehydrogenase (short-subunit alcohol dehydrogenase family)